MADIFRGIVVGRYLPNEYSCPSHPPPPLNPMRCIRFPEKINHLSVMRVMVGILYDGRREERPRLCTLQEERSGRYRWSFSHGMPLNSDAQLPAPNKPTGPVHPWHTPGTRTVS